ncbi:MAG: beta-N-acetylglucosaminidase domain-containing protein [Roseburia sp.]|nr:beta-N-acetylglucosaminidase domain-containing protein [Roseburia sp.]
MKNKFFKRAVAALMAAVLVLSDFGGIAPVSAEEIQVRTETNAQMSSDPEYVYVNAYSDPAIREQNFDENWKFYLGEASGAENATYDDSRWESVNLPHDYSIEQEYTAAGEAESAYLLGGTGWYRKYFTLTEALKDKEIRIDFGGVYMNSTVWINGTKLGTHPYGYTPFSYDITDYVEFGKENVITVKVDHQTPSSRWYSGSGIYRSVNLTIMDKVHVDLYGTKIETPNLETEKGGTVNMSVATTVANAGTTAANVVLTHTIYEKGTTNSIGTVTTEAQTVEANASAKIDATLQALNPKLWGIGEENAHLYTVKTEVKVGEYVVDTYETEYGFRYIDFDTQTGFSLNGQNMKLKGVCMHHDQGALGAEAYYRAIERQVEILQEMGCNSIRVTHNPAADELIEICNAKGMLVVEEAFDGWMYNKNGNSKDYSNYFETAIDSGNNLIGADAEPMPVDSTDDILGAVEGLSWAQYDLTSMIRRGQNAPSIIMWSLGNEVWEGAWGSEDFPEVARTLISWATALDSSRPSTIGDNKLKESNSNSFAMSEALTAAGGITGSNYCSGSNYDNVYNRYKNVENFALYGSETASHTNSRGVYDTRANNSLNEDNVLTAYDDSAVGWGATASGAWYDIITRDYVAGEYVWTGFDYLGEPTPANGTDSGFKQEKATAKAPKNSFFGIIDTAGLPKDNYYFYQSQWNDEVTTLHVLPAWNEDAVVSGDVPIVVYSDAAAVELFFTDAEGNRESLGKKEFTVKTSKNDPSDTTGSGIYTYQIYEGEGKNNTTHKNLYLTWYKAFEEGTIEAVAYDREGNVISDTEGRSMVTTTGAAAKLVATVDRNEIKADGKDLAYIKVDVTDAEGNIVPNAENNVKFVVEGNGVLVGIDNGKQPDHQSFQDDNRDAFSGSLVAIVQSEKTMEDGSFTVKITSEGLTQTTVTVATKAVANESAEAQIRSFYMSKNYYVKKGSTLKLPTTMEAYYTDGSTKNLSVEWDTVGNTTQNGTFIQTGVVSDDTKSYGVSVVVNVIDEVGGLLNYSTTTAVGKTPVLPDTRQAVLVDGTILNASFPVEWETISEASYAQAGTFVVNGSANVLGKPIAVTASVRVQDEQIEISGSIDRYLDLVQDIPTEKQSDTLTAIWDGNTVIDANTNGGSNESLWTNYTNSQPTDTEAGDNTAEITFNYATEQRIGEIVIHFAKDSYAMEYPDAGTTEIYVSPDGADGSWVKVAAKESMGEEVDNVKPYTYSFAPVTAVYVKFCLTNSTAVKTAATCTGITEIEMKKAVGSYTTYTTAELASLTVNDKKVGASSLANGAYYTLDKSAEVVAAGKDNAAVTVLPIYNETITMIIESEDHFTRENFVIYLNKETPVGAEDSSKDIPVSVLSATAGDQHNESEGASKVLDGDTGTIWHTNWYGTSNENHYIDFVLSEDYIVSGLRYLPRSSGGTNGIITTYEILVSNDGTNWESVAEGNWAEDRAWKVANFDGYQTKYVRLRAHEAVSNNDGYVFASASEIRLVGRKPEPEAPMSAISVKTAPKTLYSVGSTFDPTGLVLNLIYKDGQVRELAYSDEAEITFDVTGELTVENTAVVITYGEFTVTLPIAVMDVEIPEPTPEVGPDEDGRDIPREGLEAISGSAYPGGGNEGPASLVLDNNANTHWHTNYNTNEGSNVANRWIGIRLPEVTTIGGIRFLPRTNGGSNGTPTTYRVEYRATADGEWIAVATGSWDISDASWKRVEFDAVEAKEVRVVGVNTYADSGNDAHMSAAELRVIKPLNVSDPAEKTLAAILITEAPDTLYTVGDTFNPTGLVLTRVYSDGTSDVLEYSAEAGITFSVTDAFAEAGNKTVTVTYLEKTTTLNVVVQPVPTLTGIEVSKEPKTVYTEGDTFNPTGLKVKLLYDNEAKVEVAYAGNESAFAFAPNEALATEDTSVTITYTVDGKSYTTELPIEVNEPPVLERIEVKTAPNKLVYKAGEQLEVAGLVLTLYYSDTSTTEVAYNNDTAAKFGFTPAAGSVLQPKGGDQEVTVTYEGKTTEFLITVNQKQVEINPDDSETPDVPGQPDVPSVDVPSNPVTTPSDAYEIYPIPHDMQYYEGSWILGTQANVIYEDGIDEATKARLEETMALKGIKTTEATSMSDGKVNVLVGIYGSDGFVDQYVKKNYSVSNGLFEKTDAYFFATSEDTIVVLGKDTDAAFYGLTTLYHIFAQTEGKAIYNFTIEDYADVVSRGFIEGYYGNPWSVEDRIELMKWGGYYKLNSYFYAPKDDPKHNAKWRELYTQEEIDRLIKPLAEAGNASKCRFVFALHPYMNNAIRYNSEANYQADLKIMQAKFAQVIEAGVRQISILADDAANVGGANYIKTLEDMTAWIREMQKTYPDLKLTLPFCTQEYMYNGESYYANFPENVQIVMTGGRIWGEVSENFTTTFTNNVGRGPYLWVNWPCTDNSKQHLIMGGYSTFLHPNVDPSKIEGIVLNPMQQSEPSKVAIFGNAAYSWNIWDSVEEAENAWEASFAHVDHISAVETRASEALKELSYHMMNQNMDSRVTALQESVAIKDTLKSFKDKLTVGNVTKEECDAIIAIFENLQNAAEIYATSGNSRIKEQIVYWLNCWEDTTNAAILLLEAIKADIDGDANTLLAKYNEGSSAFAQSKTYGFHYVDHTEYAEVGVQHIVPFIRAAEDYASKRAELILNPDAMITTYITSRSDSPAVGSVDNIVDGNEDTKVIYKSPSAIYQGDYVGLLFSKVIDITNVKFVLGAGKDHFDAAKVEYTMDGKTWTALEGNYTGVVGQVQRVELTEENLPSDFKAMGIRLIATVDNAADAWLEVREIGVNVTQDEQNNPSDVEVSYNNLLKPSTWSVYQGPESNLYDGNDNTFVWYNPGNGDTYQAGDYLGYNFGQVLQLASAHIVVGSGDGDKIVNYVVETSLNGTTWNVIPGYENYSGNSSGTDVLNIELKGLEAQYIRLRTLASGHKWIKFSEFTVTPGTGEVEASTENVYTNVSNANVYSEAEGGSVTLTGAALTLNAGDYIGIDLKNIKGINGIETSAATGDVKLETSMNGIIWEEVTNGTYPDARYIRLVNKGTAVASVAVDGFNVSYDYIAPKSVTSDMSNLSSSDDMRTKGNVDAVFDGKLDTSAKLCSTQIAGKHVTFDLGQTITLNSIRYYIVEMNNDYLRHAKFEASANGTDWTEVLIVGNADAVNMEASTVAKDAPYLTHDSMNPGNMYAEATGLDVKARYIRVVPQTTYSGRWMVFSEIQINGGAYQSVEDNKDIISDTMEAPYQNPSNALDKDFGTYYENSAASGSFTYRLSEPQDVQSIRIIQVRDTSNATVTAEFEDISGEASLFTRIKAFVLGEGVEIGKLDQSINEFNVPDGKWLKSITVTWNGKAPVISEIMTFKTKSDATEVLAEMEVLLDTDVDVDKWTKVTKTAYETAKANAQAAVDNEYISKVSAQNILAALQNAIDNGVVRYTKNELQTAVNNALSNADGIYTAKTYTAYEEAITNAQIALNDKDNLSAEDGEALYNAIVTTKDALVYTTVNKETAQLLVSNIGKYTEETVASEKAWKALTDAKAALEELLATDTEENRVNPNEYVDVIEDAQVALEFAENLAEIRAEAERMDSKKPFEYIEATWNAYTEAIKEAEKCLAGTAKEVAEAIGVLRTAKDALASSGAKMSGYTLSLEGNIGVNFYVKLSEAVLADTEAYMNFTIGGKETSKVSVADAEMEEMNGITYYVFKCMVPVKDMDTEIEARIVLSGDRESCSYKYKVENYVDYILENPSEYYEETIELVEAMSTFGEYATTYFTEGTNPELSEEMLAITSDTLKEYQATITGDNNDIYYGSSLLLKSETVLRHYFTEKVEGAKQKGDLYYIEYTGIAAHELGDDITVTVETTAGDIEITYSPLSYAYIALSKGSDTDNLTSLMRAMYLYHQAAQNYLEVNKNN